MTPTQLSSFRKPLILFRARTKLDTGTIVLVICCSFMSYCLVLNELWWMMLMMWWWMWIYCIQTVNQDTAQQRVCIYIERQQVNHCGGCVQLNHREEGVQRSTLHTRSFDLPSIHRQPGTWLCIVTSKLRYVIRIALLPPGCPRHPIFCFPRPPPSPSQHKLSPTHIAQSVKENCVKQIWKVRYLTPSSILFGITALIFVL